MGISGSTKYITRHICDTFLAANILDAGFEIALLVTVSAVEGRKIVIIIRRNFPLRV